MAHTTGEPIGEAERADLLARLGTSIDEPYLTRALTHRSYAFEHGGLPTNERLEFLGDSVLGLVATDLLFHEFPDLSEGELSRRRAAIVSTNALSFIADQREIGGFLLLGHGEELTGGHHKASLLADMVESLIGACYLTGGLEAARPFVLNLLSPLITRVDTLAARMDPKTTLQEAVADRGLDAPVYEVTSTGPDHDRHWSATVTCGGRVHARGEGTSKKQAEMAAAFNAWKGLVDLDLARANPPRADA
ncbi:MAG: ribonuclease III [Pseudoclavibacter caeni]